MEEETVPTLEQVYKDFRGRRSGLLKALTLEVDDFVNQCDPAKQNLCLYGFPDESWEVKLPVEEVPPELPEPVVGINFSRDGMDHQDWLSLVAVHSDAWLLAVAFFFGAKFDKGERKKLFGLITDLPTLYDVVIGRAPAKEKVNAQNTATKGKTSSAGKVRAGEVQQKVTRPPPPPPEEEDESDEDDEDEHENALCGKCGENYAANEFWICCDSCEQWFHGKCVKVTPAKAQTMKHYKCPGCSSKKPRT